MNQTFHGLFNVTFMVVLLFTSGVLAASRKADDGHDHVHNPFEPVVTLEEAKLLNSAMQTASTNVQAAINMLQIKKLDEASPALDFAIGNLYFQLEQYDQAAKAYQDALKKHEKFRSAMMNLGRVYLLQEQTNKAIELYQQLVQDGQADADILLLLGHALLMENYPVSAEIAYQQCLLLRPKDADAMLGLAKSLIQQQRYTQGLALIGEILQQDPTQKELWSLRANAFLALGQNAKAIRAIETARRLKSATSDMLVALGDLYLNQAQAEDALAAYGQAFENKSLSIQRMLRGLEGFLMIRDPNAAGQMLARIENALKKISSPPNQQNNIKLLRLKGELADLQGDREKAMKFYQDLLRLDPLDAKTLLLLAQAQQQQGQLEEAAMTCERAARIQGHETNSLILYAQIEVERQRYTQAVELLEAAQTFKHQVHVQRYLEQVRRMVQ
jgi:tetratricopeptide (TPR) repeat protein